MISPSPHYISLIHHPQPTHLLPPSPHELHNCKLKLCSVVCRRRNCVVPWEAAGIQGVWSQQLVGGSCVRWHKCFLFVCKWESIVGEFWWFGEVLPYSLCWCEFSGVLRKYDAEFCFLGRRGLCAGLRLKVSSGKGGRKPVGSKSWWGDTLKVKLRLRASNPKWSLG